MKGKIAVSGNVIAIKINAEITKKEHDRINQVINKVIAEKGRIRLCLNIEHYPSLNSAESLYEDLKFAKIYSDYIDRMAVVGDRPWKKTLVAIFGLFGGIQAEYFDRPQVKAVWKWVQES